MTKVKKLARAGWRGGVKPALKKTGKVALKAGKVARKHHVPMTLANNALRAGAAAADVAVENPAPSILAETAIQSGATNAAGKHLVHAASHAAIKGKDMLMQKYFGAQHNKGSSHSGKNYAVKRKPAVRYHSTNSSPEQRSERVVKPAPHPLPSKHSATLHNSSHLYSASHPTGGKIS